MPTLRKAGSFAILAAALFAATVLGSCQPEADQRGGSNVTPVSIDRIEAKKEGPALWTIEKSKGHIWFFGSVHVLPPGQDWRTPELEAAMKAADVVVLEIPFDEARSIIMQGYVLSQAISLSQPALSTQGTEEEQAALAKAARAAGLEPYQLDKMRPWFASISLTMSLLTKAGFDPNNGVDQHIDEEAKRLGKERQYFESAREQIDFFITLPEDVQMQMLRDTVTEINENPEMVDKLIEAWRNSDLENLGELTNDSYTSPELEKVLITDRNVRWVKRIDEWLDDDKSYLIVVGAGHLAGDDSVVALLRDRGVEVDGP
jgi:uncharacterized protein YbaP (TraB family)